MAFRVGDRVHLAHLGTGSIVESRGGDRYAVEIKGRIVIAAGSDLELADVKRKSPSGRKATATAEGVASGPGRQRSSPSIDLHGRTTDEAVEVLQSFINDALLAGHSEARIIHGRSGTRVRDAVHRYLRTLPVVSGFRVDARNPGVTVVNF
jgi:DNA mismatch repair protein MutS2